MAKCSTALCQCRVDPFLFTVSFGIRLLLKKWLNTTESGKATLCSAMWTISYLWKETSSRIQSFVHWLLRGKDRKSEALTKAFYTSISIFTETFGTHTHTHTRGLMGAQAAAPLLTLQVKRPTLKGHMAQPLASLAALLCISAVHEAPRHPPLLSLAHARLLVAVAESRACQEPCLGATWNDKMRMRASGWHMVLISSQVYRGSPSTEHNQTYAQHPAHWTSSHTCTPIHPRRH